MVCCCWCRLPLLGQGEREIQFILFKYINVLESCVHQ